MFPPVDPIIFSIGPFALRWYGVLMLAGVLATSIVASREVARRGEDPDNLWDMLLWILIPGFIGARLYYVFVQSPRDASGLGYFLQNSGEILKVWSGGIHIFGGFIAGGLALWVFTRLRNLNPLPYLDGIALGLPLGQAIARWGNFINQELYGPPTSLPWGLRIDMAHRLAPYNNLGAYPESVRFHSLFLYESLWNFIGFFLVFWLSRRFQNNLKPGDIALMYLIWYPLGRFFIEFLRTDSWFFPGTAFNIVHMLSAISILMAVVGLYLRHRKLPAKRQNT
ncbi:MAG: prolipoprotein diacylglyceryl transferase [Cyanobacteria bacterium P01_D01_bin.156]